jgi:succinate dehydrogenase/fumarate reductase flavoprotein subunit
MTIRVLNVFVICLLFLGFSACGPTEQNHATEVLVIGGTTSGISAGLQSARLNVPTLIVEETPWLGGMITAAGVSATDGNHHLHSGIWNEFRDKLRTYYGGAAALSTGWVSHTLFEPHVGDSIFKSMAAAEQQLSVIYGYHLTEILKEGNKVTGAVFENEQMEKLTVLAKVVIDATDLGDGLAMAGAAYDLGMEARSVTGEANAPEVANNIVQDLTWAAILKDFGPEADKTIEKPASYDPELFQRFI